jgi:hypothetical protein
MARKAVEDAVRESGGAQVTLQDFLDVARRFGMSAESGESGRGDGNGT